GSKGYSFKVKFTNVPENIKRIMNTLTEKYKLSEISWITIPENYKGELPSWINVDVDHMLRYAWLDRVKEFIPEEKEKFLTFEDF
ncbi:MAG: hypothetical protein ACPLX8_02015, partial [Nanopusillaceae archaeon]